MISLFTQKRQATKAAMQENSSATLEEMFEVSDTSDVEDPDGDSEEGQAEEEYDVDPDRESADDEAIEAIIEEVQAGKYKLSNDEEHQSKYAVTKVSSGRYTILFTRSLQVLTFLIS